MTNGVALGLPSPSAGYHLPTMAFTETSSHSQGGTAQLREALRTAAAALKENGPRFALAGSYALWAYGAPEPVHDVDFVVAETDAEAAEVTLRKAGFQIVHVPEDWLFKAYPDDDVLVDVLYQLNGASVDAATLESA